MKQKVIIFLLNIQFVLVLHARNNQDTSIIKLSLDTALEIAYNERYSLQARKYRIWQQGDLEWAELSKYFLQTSVRTEVNKVTDDLLPIHQTFVSINQSIFNIDNILHYKIAQQSTEIAKFDEKLHKDLIQFETETSYLDLWNIAQQHASICAIEYSAKKQIKQAKTQDKVRLLSTTQWLDEVAIFEENMAIVESYKDNLSRAYYTLSRAMEEKITVPLHDHTTEQFIENSINIAQQYSLDYYLKKALLYRKEIPIVETEVKQERYLKKLFGYSYVPSVSLFFDVSIGTFFSLFENGGSQTFWQTGLRFAWNFDGFSNAYRSKAAHNSMCERTFEKHNIISQIKLEVEITYHELQQLLKQLKAVENRFNQAKEEYKQQSVQFNIGEISADEFATAESNWQQAKFTLLDIRVQNARKYRELLFRCGYPTSKRSKFLC